MNLSLFKVVHLCQMEVFGQISFALSCIAMAIYLYDVSFQTDDKNICCRWCCNPGGGWTIKTGLFCAAFIAFTITAIVSEANEGLNGLTIAALCIWFAFLVLLLFEKLGVCSLRDLDLTGSKKTEGL